MKHIRRILCPLALVGIALVVLSLPGRLGREAAPPGLTGRERALLRIWVTGSPGGAQAWLTESLRAWEKQHPGVMTYLRQVPPDALTEPDAVLPDLVLYTPGDVPAPEALFAPLSGEVVGRESLLRCGRWQGSQYGLPLCWGGWVLAIDGTLEPGTLATPAPTTLLGRPAATAIEATEEPGYPHDAAAKAECGLQSPGGAALFALSALLDADERPPLPGNFATMTAADVYSAFLSQKAATAMLTTGQVTALSSLASTGKAFPFRVMVPEEVVTDQVWLASVVPGASGEAAALLAYLTGREAQERLAAQGLHTVRDDLTLYATGVSAQVERAARRALSAINAYLPAQEAADAAWRAFQGNAGFSEALAPLL